MKITVPYKYESLYNLRKDKNIRKIDKIFNSYDIMTIECNKVKEWCNPNQLFLTNITSMNFHIWYTKDLKLFINLINKGKIICLKEEGKDEDITYFF